LAYKWGQKSSKNSIHNPEVESSNLSLATKKPLTKVRGFLLIIFF
jgi:hypothetical protein